jgi:hypothetical protein
MQQYRWALRVTTDYMDRNGDVAEQKVEIREAPTEEVARARLVTIEEVVTLPERSRPKWQRISAVKLLRLPVGEWEEVS